MKSFRDLIFTLTLTAWLPGVLHAEFSYKDQPPGTALEQGLWWLYHLQYDQARQRFDQYTAANPTDPAGYFYKTAADWWQLAQQFDRSLPDIETRMDKDYQDTVRVADALLSSAKEKDDKQKGLACLYAGGAEGLKGRWLVTQKQWMSAYFMGKKGHNMLLKALQYDPTLYDAYMGLGIYDYFTDTLAGVQKVLAAILIRGDRKRGLQELQQAIDHGQHARVEAMTFLIEIYTWEEHTPEKALPLAQALHKEYPKSSAMYLAEIMEHYELQQWDKVRTQAGDYLQKSQQELPYYPKEGVYPAWYCLGVSALLGKHDADTCMHYMEKILENPETTSRWVTFAYLRMGQVYDLKGDREKALSCYQKVLDRPHFWGSRHEARAYTKEPFKF